jgi:hypothetical protein
MGLLEDAIREHLDLKRAHGADAGEVAQQERDALGPPQRAAVPAPAREPEPAEPEPDPEGAVEPMDDLEAAPFVEDEPAPAPPPREDPDLGFDEPFSDEPPAPADETDAVEEEVDLEETPEFLQETPEHDRLWFEQKPPKDFDFGS